MVASPVWAATFTVNRAADTPDANLANAACDVNASQQGNQCTLRAAIQEANDTNGADEIRFNIVSAAAVKTIFPTSALPTITEAVTINGYTQTGASQNTLAEGNDAVLKVQLNGTNAGPAHGLVIEAPDTTIRGLVINRFVGNGVFITGSGAKVLGNFVGTNAAGSAPLGNGGDGVEIFDASACTVGGARAAARNVISGNTDDGVEFQGDTLGNEVLGNYIGTRASSTQDLGNGEDGVNIRDGAFNNIIGGTASGAGNRIAHNGQDRVFITRGTGNSVLSNVIFSNTGLGIDLDPNGVTNNDTDDPDTGANNLQNFPVITSAIKSSTTPFPGATTITGTLNSNPNQTYIIQCFVAVPDSSGHGEGQIPVAQTTATTNANGDDSSFSCVSPIPQVGQTVTATVTRLDTSTTPSTPKDTSEFSLNVGVVAGP